MERIVRMPSGKKEWYRLGMPLVSAIAAVTTLTACGGSSESSAEKAAPSTAPASALQEPSAIPSEKAAPVAVPETPSGDPRAYQCRVEPNPYPGTYEVCPIPDGGIEENGVPVFRYTNLSGSGKRIPYSTTKPAFVKCRIPEEVLPGSFASLHDGGEYILGGEYGGKAVAPADVFYNPTMPPNELSYDPGVRLCSKVAIAAVTARS